MADPGVEPLEAMPGPADPAPADVEEAAKALESLLAGRDHVCSAELPAAVVAVQFLGIFQGRRVAWKMALRALQSRGGPPRSTRPGSAGRSFMQIAAAPDGAFALEVGLGLVAIDEPALKKTLIMIRNFKRLELGRHEWGEALP